MLLCLPTAHLTWPQQQTNKLFYLLSISSLSSQPTSPHLNNKQSILWIGQIILHHTILYWSVNKWLYSQQQNRPFKTNYSIIYELDLANFNLTPNNNKHLKCSGDMTDVRLHSDKLFYELDQYIIFCGF